jgi:hypothetical protein
MSRSRPDPTNDPNPAGRWYEWQGEHGLLRYYDKPTKTTIAADDQFTFLLLDQLSSIRGYHDPSRSTIYANEIRSIKHDPLVVRAFKGGELARGHYADIKARVHEVGGRFCAHCYIASKVNGALALNAIRWKGAALAAWWEFGKAHRGELYASAIQLSGTVEGVKGRVHYKVPAFALKPVSPATEARAQELDGQLQAYLARYLARDQGDGAAAQAVASAEPVLDVEDEAPPIEDEDVSMWDDGPVPVATVAAAGDREPGIDDELGF